VLISRIVVGGNIEIIESLVELIKTVGLLGDGLDILDGALLLIADDFETLIGQPLVIIPHLSALINYK
jgi:hypothetical protein